jgi:ABC-2 type transport system permease protein
MTRVLVRKLLRDVRTPLIAVMLLLLAFQCLWCKVTQRISGQLLPFLTGLAEGRKMTKAQLDEQLFTGPSQSIKTLIGGENIDLGRAMDVLSIGYVHPLVQAILCIWGIGRAASAITGEIDRGTMELLLAQPIERRQVVLAHLCVDLITIPLLCLAMWSGTLLGVWLVGPLEVPAEDLARYPDWVRKHVNPDLLRLEPLAFAAALPHAAALVFAVSGITMFLSACGRVRGRVLGLAVLLTLLQFLINLIAQLWPTLDPLRPLTIFYYYQPQEVILKSSWLSDGMVWLRLAVLLSVGTAGYALALRVFCRRDLPAPL